MVVTSKRAVAEIVGFIARLNQQYDGIRWLLAPANCALVDRRHTQGPLRQPR
jgi:hypothetical protein